MILPFFDDRLTQQEQSNTQMQPQMKTWLTATLLLVSIHMHSVRTQAADMELQEYCEYEIFDPQCGENEAVLIKHARYGRMREGRCIETGAADIGCAMDASSVLDLQCSGRQSCDVPVIGIPPIKDPPCRRSLRGYLEAAYECIDVIYPPNGYCLTGDVIEVKQPHGYFSNLVAEETGCGSINNPWWVVGNPGEQVRFHLLTFETGANREYATLYDGPTKTTKRVYAGTSGRNLVFTSTSERVKVTIQSVHNDEGGTIPFLLEFEVVGCANIPAPEHGWVRRSGMEIEFGCNNTNGRTRTWKMDCKDRKWVGDNNKCVAAKPEEVAGTTVSIAPVIQEFSLEPEHKVLLITIAIGIANVIGLCILICGIVYICRRWRERRRCQNKSVSTMQRNHQRPAGRRSLAKEGVEEEGEYYCPTESDYYGTWQMKHLRKGPSAAQPGPSSPDGNVPPLPPPYTPSCGSSSYYCNSQGDDHVYERPIFLPNQSIRGEEGSRSLKYYELDPNYVESGQGNRA